MGVYIKGMEMPKEGSWRSIRIYPDGTIGRPIGFGDYALVEGAKAVPVPPHGRLIDADALFRKVKTECNPYGKPTIEFESGKKVLEMIENAPTIIEAEEGDG